MYAKVFLLTLSLLTVALAGCASPPPADDGALPTATPTPTPTSTDTTGAPGGDEAPTDEPMEPLTCAPVTGTPATASAIMGYPQLAFNVEEPNAGDACYQFVAPTTATAGWTAITFTNNGMSPHIMPMYRLVDGHTAAELQTAMNAPVGPEWATPVGGVGFVTPFSAATALVDLQEGTYAFVCPFEGHHMKGMVHELTVTGTDEAPAAAPVSDIRFRAMDFAYELPGDLMAGTYVIEFTNDGTQPHEFPLVKLDNGTTLAQFLEAIEKPNGSPPPGAGVGGVNIVAPGMSAFAIVELTEGAYGLVCFVGSPDHDGAPHIALGMLHEFSVGSMGAEGTGDASNTTS